MREFFVGIKTRLLDSIILAPVDDQTRRLALLCARLIHGFHLQEIVVMNSELKAIGFEMSKLFINVNKINDIEWYAIEYTQGPNGKIVVKQNSYSQYYKDRTEPHLTDLVLEVGIRGRGRCQKENKELSPVS